MFAQNIHFYWQRKIRKKLENDQLVIFYCATNYHRGKCGVSGKNLFEWSNPPRYSMAKRTNWSVKERFDKEHNNYKHKHIKTYTVSPGAQHKSCTRMYCTNILLMWIRSSWVHDYSVRLPKQSHHSDLIRIYHHYVAIANLLYSLVRSNDQELSFTVVCLSWVRSWSVQSLQIYCRKSLKYLSYMPCLLD